MVVRRNLLQTWRHALLHEEIPHETMLFSSDSPTPLSVSDIGTLSASPGERVELLVLTYTDEHQEVTDRDEIGD